MASKEVIDIHCDKFTEWLVSRNKVSSKWQNDLKPVRSRLQKAINELPLDIKAELDPDTITYFTCLHIMEVLQKAKAQTGSGATTRNFFGKYTDEQMRAWDDIANAYRKNNLYLAECGRVLTQCIVYDLPQMKNLIKTNEKQIQQSHRKITDTQKQAEQARAKYDAACQRYSVDTSGGVASEHVLRSAIKASAKQVTELLERVHELATSDKLGQAIEYFLAFVKFTLSAAFPEEEAKHGERLATLSSLRKRPFQSSTSDNSTEDGDAVVEIDWNPEATDEKAGKSASNSGSDDGVIEINWDEGVLSETTAAVTSASASTDTSKRKADDKKGVADSDSLEHNSTRHAFVTDLMELESFLQQRLIELRASDAHTLSSQFLVAGAPAVLQRDKNDLQGYLDAVQSVLKALQDENLTQLLLIRTNPRFVERLVASVSQLRVTYDRQASSATSQESRRRELADVIEKTSRKLKQTVEMAKGLKANMEQSVSALFNQATVHIFGDISV